MMDSYNTHPENPFVLKEGDSREVGLYNRIAAINRVNYLVKQKIPTFDIYDKPDTYRFAIDTEMHKRHYKDKPDAKIDEDFCQHMAEICLEFEEGKTDPAKSEEEPKSVLESVTEPKPQTENAWAKILKKLRIRK